MEELNKIFKGFEVLTTPYDKVDSRVITKKNAITLLNQIGGADQVGKKNNTENGNNEGGTEEGGTEEGGPSEGGTEDGAGAGAGEGGTEEGGNNNSGDPEGGSSGEKKPGFLEKARLAAAEASEEDKGTTIPDGKEMMKKVIRVGAIIMYIMLLPLMPWYYVMKHSFAKLNILYKGVVKPL